MADYSTRFSCLFDVGSEENVADALELYRSTPEDEYGDRLSDGFLLSWEKEDGTQLWIRDDMGGDVERVIKFVLLCAYTFDLKGRWGFQYANTCTNPNLDGFGGGAHVVDLSARKTVGWTTTYEWQIKCARPGGGAH